MRAKKNFFYVRRALRGGCFSCGDYYLRVAPRDGDEQDIRDEFLGFRLVIRKKA